MPIVLDPGQDPHLEDHEGAIHNEGHPLHGVGGAGRGDGGGDSGGDGTAGEGGRTTGVNVMRCHGDRFGWKEYLFLDRCKSVCVLQ